jgi:hypothetical protein
MRRDCIIAAIRIQRLALGDLLEHTASLPLVAIQQVCDSSRCLLPDLFYVGSIKNRTQGIDSARFACKIFTNNDLASQSRGLTHSRIPWFAGATSFVGDFVEFFLDGDARHGGGGRSPMPVPCNPRTPLKGYSSALNKCCIGGLEEQIDAYRTREALRGSVDRRLRTNSLAFIF